MAALSSYRPQVPAAVAHPDFAAVRAGLDKVTLGDVAAQVGLAAPHTEPATEDNLARWTGPLVLKSRSHWTPGARHVQRIDARLFATPAEATERIELIVASGGEAVMQRPVHGQLGALIGVFHEGRLRGRVQQTTARLWPSPSGMSSRAQTVPVDAVLCARAEDLLGRIGWRGLVELQFLTGDDGVPHLIDLNGRFYGSLALADAACPGLLEAWARQALGVPVPDLPDGRTGLRYAWWAGDLRRARVERRGGLVSDVAGTLRWGLGARHSVWSARDLGPTWRLVRERSGAVDVPVQGGPARAGQQREPVVGGTGWVGRGAPGSSAAKVRVGCGAAPPGSMPCAHLRAHRSVLRSPPCAPPCR